MAADRFIQERRVVVVVVVVRSSLSLLDNDTATVVVGDGVCITVLLPIDELLWDNAHPAVDPIRFGDEKAVVVVVASGRIRNRVVVVTMDNLHFFCCGGKFHCISFRTFV